MVYKFLGALSLLLCRCLLAGQSLSDVPLKEVIVGNSGQDNIIDIYEHWTGDLAVVGNTTKGPYGGDDIFFLILDNNLQIKQQRYIGRSGDDGATAITRTLDGHYLVSGFTSKPTDKKTGKTPYFGGKDGWALTMDEQGNTKEEFIFGTPANDEFIRIFPLSYGGMMIVGNSGDHHVWLLKVDGSGKVILDIKIQYHKLSTRVNSAIVTTNEELYLTGFVEEGQSRQMWLASFNLQAEKNWEKTYPASEAWEGVNLAEIDHKSLAVVGYVMDKERRENGFYCTIDTKGNQLTYHTLGGREDDRLADVIPLHNHRIALIGTSKSFERGSRRDKVWTIILDKTGKIQKEKFYGSKTTDRGDCLWQQSDGSIIGAGLTSQNLLKSKQGWLAQFSKPINPKVQDLKNIKVSVEGVIYPDPKVAQPWNRPIIQLTLTNTNDDPLTSLSLTIQPLGAKKPNPKNIVLPLLPANVSKKISIPIVLPTDIEPFSGTFELKILSGLKPFSESLFVDFQMGTPLEPVLELTCEQKPPSVQKGVINQAEYKVKNTGGATAFGLYYEVHGSPELNFPQPILIGDILPGEAKYFVLPFSLKSGNDSDSIWIRTRVNDAGLNHTDMYELKLPVASDRPQSEAEQATKGDFIKAVWLNPNPDQYEYSEILWSQEEIIIQIKVISNKPLDKRNFCLEINGIPCESGAKMDEVTLKGTPLSRTFIQKVRLKEGTNLLKARVSNPAGKTETEAVKIIYTAGKPNLHVISIGVPSIDLKYTTKDAVDFARVFRSTDLTHSTFHSVFVDTLVNEKMTTKTEILKSLRRLQYRFEDRQIGPNDLILAFVSSHGISTQKGEFRIAAGDYDGPFLHETSLDFEKDFLDYLQPIQCRKLFLIDACHSGASGDDVFLTQASSSIVFELASHEQSLNLLTSCRANEYSYEDDSWQNGAFTKALLNTLQEFQTGNRLLDLNEDGKYDVQEMFEHIREQVPRLVSDKRPKTRTSQNPMLHLVEPSAPMVLFQVPNQK